jgi:hypothetical protein
MLRNVVLSGTARPTTISPPKGDPDRAELTTAQVLSGTALSYYREQNHVLSGTAYVRKLLLVNTYIVKVFHVTRAFAHRGSIS